MKNGNRLREPFILVLTATLILSALSFSDTEFSVGNFSSKKVDMFSDIEFQHKNIAYVFPDIVFTDKIKDSLSSIKRARDLIAVRSYSKDSIGAMDMFYKSLLLTKSKGKKTRIAYFGDSMIEGDLCTQDLRKSFQAMFGGRGVGFVPITSIVAGFRQTITHVFSKDWIKYDFHDKGGKEHPVGPSGSVFVPNAGSWVKYIAPKAYGPFNTIKLYYGTGNSDARVSITKDADVSTIVLNGANAINEAVVNENGTVNAVTMSFNCPTPINIYGASFESGSGVYLDNYAFRGNSGLPLTTVPFSIYNGFDEYFSYDLIVLQYGLNVVGHNVKTYSWFKKGFQAMVDHIKQAYPHASIMIVSLGDKGYRKDGVWNTEPDVLKVVQVQKEVAEENGIAFWNLYENMGGYNSMKRWVEGDTTLANQDYAHPNAKGAKKMSDLLFNKLIEGLNDYKAKVE